jgi:TRAP transporter TAXI family solute receptor
MLERVARAARIALDLSRSLLQDGPAPMSEDESNHDLAPRLGPRIWGSAILVCLLGFAIAWTFLPPPLPKVVRLGTGPDGGRYDRVGEALREHFAGYRIDLELVPTAGSMENIRGLLRGDLDIAFVQSGNLTDAEAEQLESVAAILHEPVLLVHRADSDIDIIEGGRVAIGAPGSGTHGLTLELLRDMGIRDGVPPGTRLLEIGEEQALEALRAGQADSAVFVTSLDVPWVRIVFEDPRLRVESLELAEAFTRRYRYLQRIVIPAGLIDLKEEIPPEDVKVIATTASLVMRPETHHGLIPLLIESAQAELYQGSLLAAPEEFPSPHGVEAPLAAEARHFFERGPSFFYRWLPFHYAFAATRLMILLIPLLTLLYPLLRSAGPTYRWIVQRRVFRWYRVLRRLEMAIDASSDGAGRERIRKELERVGEEIRATRVPARYAADLFQLRAHHRMLLERLR